MKTRFPKLQGFLLKPTKPKNESQDGDKKKKETLNVSNAFVYKGHIIATDGKTLFVFNLKEYMKYHVQFENGEEPATAYGIISDIVEKLEGKALSREFFAAFSKSQTIIKADEFRIYVEQNGLHSEYIIEETYNVELLEKFMANQKKVWEIERSEQGQFGISGTILSSISGVLSAEMQNDSLVFERTTDDKAKFCLVNKDFLFGITMFSLDTEKSITKFVEANEFFEVNI